MKICEAYCNERGTATGGELGNQTGRELRKRDWYLRVGGWDCCLAPVSPSKGRKAAMIAEACTASEKVGYDQDKRWTLYKELKSKGWDVAKISPCSCDCSSLVVTCYIAAGADLLPTGYTGNLERILIESGEFKRYSGDEQYGCVGAVYIKKNAHAIIVTEADEQIEEPEESTDSIERIRAKGSVRVRNVPKTGYTKHIVHKGDIVPVYGIDAESGWYITDDGFITANERYVEKI